MRVSFGFAQTFANFGVFAKIKPPFQKPCSLASELYIIMQVHHAHMAGRHFAAWCFFLFLLFTTIFACLRLFFAASAGGYHAHRHRKKKEEKYIFKKIIFHSIIGRHSAGRHSALVFKFQVQNI